MEVIPYVLYFLQSLIFTVFADWKSATKVYTSENLGICAMAKHDCSRYKNARIGKSQNPQNIQYSL
jgi:hypothetical protein